MLIVLFILLALGLPVAGVWLAGRPLPEYVEFPPVTVYVQHAGFSWPVFVLGAAALVLTLIPFLFRLQRSMLNTQCAPGPGIRNPDSGDRNPAPGICVPPSTFPPPPSTFHLPPSPLRRFPWWGWLGLLCGATFWLLAWTRFAWFAPLQPFTFSPLWFSYIVVVNAMTWRRAGRCMLLHQRRTLLLLFGFSAVFWWYFEFLNRFVQNWHYLGVSGLSPTQYFVFATLPFSTVLPAVMGTCELLQTVPRFQAAWSSFPPLRPKRPRALATLALLAGSATLAGIGVWPDYLFPLLWISPLLLITGLQTLSGRPTLFAPLAQGNWHRICILALSALVCGFFWELWNYYSLAQWVYAVPYVQRFHIFEMPLLGFAGYLPFGLECAVIADAVTDRSRKGGA